MIEGDDLILTCEDDIMNTRQCATTNCADTKLLVRTGCLPLRAVINVGQPVIECFIDRICQCQCGTGRSVHLAMVVLLDDLDVEALLIELLRRGLHELEKQVHTDRHIRTAQDRSLLRELLYTCDLVLRKTGRALHEGLTALLHIVEQTVDRRCHGEIDDHIEVLLHRIEAAIHREADRRIIEVILTVDTRDDRRILHRLRTVDYISAHRAHRAE